MMKLSREPSSWPQRPPKGIRLVFICLGIAMACNSAAGPREQAFRIHERLTGTPPTASVLDAMEAQISSGNPADAANIAIDDPAFYDITLKNFAAPWTNEAQTPFVDLNDYSATVIGAVRDDKDFRQILSGDFIYVGKPELGLPTYSLTSNTHYEQLEDLSGSLKDNLAEVPQSTVNGLPTQATAGVLTSRAGAQAFFSGGTNRAMFRFTLMNHLCTDLEPLKDTTRSPDRIRQDVSRSPGGDSRIFLNNCIGCHSGMDPLAQAFAYYEYLYDANADPDGLSGQLVYNDVGDIDPDTNSRVQKKYRINANNFPFGYVTPDDRWDNYWRAGKNTAIGWDSALPGTGSGAKSLGEELSHSEAFAQCQVKKVFTNVCLRDVSSSADATQISSMVTNFKSSGYNMKQVFNDAAVYCMGE